MIVITVGGERKLFTRQAPPDQLKAGLQTFMQNLGAETTNVVGHLESTAPPAVEEGDEIHQGLLNTLGDAQTAIEDIQSKVPGLPTDSQDAFLQGLIELGQDFEDSVASDADAALYERVPGLEPLLVDAPGCASIQGQLDGTEL